MADIVDVNGNEGGNIGTGEVGNNRSFNGGYPSPVNAEIVMQDSEVNVDYIQVDNPNSHSVEPHWRTLSNGETIWVDGDGDTNVNQSAEEGGGWSQSNPDYRILTEKA
ncbi:hypothetical protein [Psychrobacillus sp. FSL K6-1267]|uniref:hypothetical protein n=1 Tax=Psychrobacillus sp. FSL K6-1267 TaxID=2921543 RepID=UPI0030F78FEE